ncbi:MAG: hypothetical protein E4H03_02235 [Myxococcales bacterium]|nr:MAG: hypothetical protein E4H03_02235 [Myxococcales bacterium]
MNRPSARLVAPRTLLLAGLAAVWMATHPFPAVAGDLSGYINVGVAVRTGQGDVIFNRQLVNGKFSHEANKMLSFRLETDFYHDRPYYRDGSRFKARVREGYAKLRFKNADLKLGRAQITWGDIDGFIVADQVSPFDLENFIVPPFDEIRLGVDGAFFDYYFTHAYALQLLWIANYSPPDLPPDGSPFDPFEIDRISDALPGPFQIVRKGQETPPNTFHNSQAGIRLTGTTKTADWQLGYLYAYDHVPFFDFTPDPNNPLAIDATPKHGRYHLMMGNVVFPFRDVLIRLETAYNKDRTMNVVPDTLPAPGAFPDFTVRQDQWVTAGVVDLKPNISWWQNADVSLQMIYDHIMDPTPGLARADYSLYFSARLSAAYRNDTIKPKLFTIANTRGADMWLQALVDWEPIDRWRFSLEYDFFDGRPYLGFVPGEGDSGGIYGQFDKNDLVAISVRYSF